MKRLREHLALMSALVQTADRLAAEEKQQDRIIEKAAREGDHSKDADIQQLVHAQARKALLPKRRKKAAEDIVNAEDGLRAAYNEAKRRWDGFVLSKKEEVFDGFLKVVEPFFGGPEKAALTRREFDPMHIPARAAIDKAFAPQFFKYDATTTDYMTWSQFLLDHIERYCKEFGWEVPEDFKVFRTVPASRVSSETKTVKVRARQTISLPALGQRPGARGKLTDVIQEGDELEITEQQYQALARFFDRQ